MQIHDSVCHDCMERLIRPFAQYCNANVLSSGMWVEFGQFTNAVIQKSVEIYSLLEIRAIQANSQVIVIKIVKCIFGGMRVVFPTPVKSGRLWTYMPGCWSQTKVDCQ